MESVRGGCRILVDSVSDSDPIGVRQALDAGANPNVVDEDGVTPLMLSARWDRTECLDALIRKGANLEATDTNGRTALRIAAERGHLASLNALLGKNASVNSKDRFGWSALMATARYGFTDCLNALIRNRADVDAQDRIYGVDDRRLQGSHGLHSRVDSGGCRREFGHP